MANSTSLLVRERVFSMGSRDSVYLRLFIVLCLASTLLAQVSRTGGELFGTVVDQAGLRVAGSVVELRNLGTNQTRTVESDANGEFRVGNVPSGSLLRNDEAEARSVRLTPCL